MSGAKLQQQMFNLQIPIGILLLIAILYVAKVVIVPVVVAILLTFILTPIVIMLQRYGLKRGYGVTLTVVLAFSVFGVAGYMVGAQIHHLAGELPNHRKEIEAKIVAIRNEGGAFAELVQMFREIGKEIGAKPGGPEALGGEKEVIVTRPEEPSSLERIIDTTVPVLEPLARAGFVIILVIFMLFHREDLRNRFIGLLGDGRLTGTTRVIVDSAQRLSRYLLTQALINLVFGIIFAVGLYFMKVEYALLWGFVTALMRFIPYIGTWISVLLPLTLSFATSPTWAQPVTLLIYFGVLDVLTANVVEPMLLGHRTGVSPIALLVAAAFWTWLWGPMGLVLSTPLTVCMVVIGQHVPQLRFLALLLGDQAPLEPRVQYYQRLLARDEAEAKEVVAEYVKCNGLEKVYDGVLLPALGMARQDRKDAGLRAEDEEFIIKATREILAGLEAEPVAELSAVADEAQKANEAIPAPERRVLLLGCPAHHQTEELALQMLARLLKPEDCAMTVLSTRALPVEIETQIVQMAPAVVIIAVLPPGGLAQARFLCQQIRRRFADLSIVVGHWGEVGDFDRLFRQVRSAGGNYVATSLLQARGQIVALVHPETAEEPRRAAAVLQEI